jgi:arylsulfatase A-like enzyme
MDELSRRSLLINLAGATGAAGAWSPKPAAASPDTQGGSPQASRLNLIHIGVDTWGTHWLGCYGNSHVRTPNADALAAKSAVFADAYPEALPTLPVRRSVYTGRRIFPADLIVQPDDPVKIRGWHQLYAEDVTLSETLRAARYRTGFVTDIYHQFKPDKNFHRGFDSWHYVRGQEGDRFESGPRKAINLADYLHPSQAKLLKWNAGDYALPAVQPSLMQYLLNRRSWKTEEDWLASQVFREAAHWLDNNANEGQPFYLHIESFSPHEFWDPPERFYRMYMKSDYRGPRLISPPVTTRDMSPVEIEHVRALYAGYVTFVDERLGQFLKKVEAMGLMQNTVVVFVADHGTMMGEQNQFHKGETRIRTQVTHLPLMIHAPRGRWADRRISGFVQHTDIMPTVLEMLGVKAPARVTGESLVQAAESRRGSRRDTVITGWGEHGAVRTPEWCYIGRWSQGAPFNELYDVRRDPDELHNVADQNPNVVKELKARLKQHVDSGWALTRGTFATTLLGPQG